MGSLLLGGSRETPGARGKDGRAVGGQVLLLTCSRSGGRISPGCSCSAQPQHPSPPGSEDPAARKTGENNPRGSPRYVMNKHVVAVRMSQNTNTNCFSNYLVHCYYKGSISWIKAKDFLVYLILSISIQGTAWGAHSNPIATR